MSTSKSYPGQQYLISYLNERGNKSSYYGFLNSYNNVLIVASTFSDSWQDLNNTWISHFLEKIEKLDLNQKDFKRKINVECLRYAKEMQIIWEKVINENKKDTLQDKQKRGLKRVRDDNTDTENLSTEHWTNFRAKQGKFSI
ncbi:hypothetical protein RhiirA4_477944 [Rhizophagus irregularis]|uniref:Uncharacterized protein n=1 Tax=Rhizophagus irregularis TaxID=588596 RepID=A0A2I1HE12_9GLOM|nr:hypothetical protein RhiirA4_477944 [Rhizophagus irregularis]